VIFGSVMPSGKIFYRIEVPDLLGCLVTLVITDFLEKSAVPKTWLDM
jgi:hypothetical protein